MHFFLQGERGIGKSYLIQEMVQKSKKKVAGFCVQRLYERGKLIGFRAWNMKRGFPKLDLELDLEFNAQNASPIICSDKTVCSNMEVTLGKEGIFFLRGERDISVLEQLILQVEQECVSEAVPLILFDEIGGTELKSVVFMDCLERILNMGKPCIGVFKSQENLIHMIKRQKLGNEYIQYHQELQRKILENGYLKTMTRDNRELYAKEIMKFLSNIK